MNRKHVVFGHVIQGFEVIKLIENLATDDKNRPFKHVNLAHCGELIMKIKSIYQLESIPIDP
jgi:cyclophilin family peptidyl-prolyl cis-trans isomerase